MVEIEFSKKAFADLAKLDVYVQQRINKKLDWLIVNFENIEIQWLHHDFSNMKKLRVGDWRVVYEIRSSKILIHAIGHRSKIYKVR